MFLNYILKYITYETLFSNQSLACLQGSSGLECNQKDETAEDFALGKVQKFYEAPNYSRNLISKLKERITIHNHEMGRNVSFYNYYLILFVGSNNKIKRTLFYISLFNLFICLVLIMIFANYDEA